MQQYHGTNGAFATQISMGGISVTMGGGELGQGFYTGDLEYEAFNWAWHQYQKDNKVVEFTVDDDQFLKLNPICPDYYSTLRYRRFIRDRGETRSYLFKVHAVWAPVVGKRTYNFNQIKFESVIAQDFLNNDTIKKIL